MGLQAYGEKLSLLITPNLTSICCVYKEKIVKNDLYRIQIRKDATFDSDRKNQFNSKQVIQILQTIVIDNFSIHSYIVDIS